MRKIAKLLNLDVDSNQKWILLFSMISGLLITFVYARMQKEIISALPAQYLAAQALVSSVTGLLISMIWKGKLRKTVLKYFLVLACLESVAGFSLACWLTFVEYNVWIFAISSLIYTSMVSRFVGKCIMAFQSKLWNERAREKYDNNSSIVGGLTCILGFTASLLVMPSLEVSVMVWGLCCILDDFGWVIVYIKNKGVLQE